MNGPKHFERAPHEAHSAFLSVLGLEVPTVANEEMAVFKVHVSPLEVQELPAPETRPEGDYDDLFQTLIGRRRPELVLPHLAVGLARLAHLLHGVLVCPPLLDGPPEERGEVTVPMPLRGVAHLLVLSGHLLRGVYIGADVIREHVPHIDAWGRVLPKALEHVLVDLCIGPQARVLLRLDEGICRI